MIYYSNGFAWRKVGDGYGVLQCAPIEDEADEAAWCDVAGFNAEPEIQAEIEAARDALFASERQEEAAALYQWSREQREAGRIYIAATGAKVAANMAAKARELMGVA